MIASGTWGSCPWEIADDGAMTIGSGLGYNPTSDTNQPWNSYLSRITSIKFSGPVNAPIQCTYLFSGCTALTSVDFTNFNAANAASLAGIFFGCSALTSLDLSMLNTANVRDFTGMFFNCSSLEILDISSFNMSMATAKGNMFYGCPSIRKISLHAQTNLTGTAWSSTPSTEPPNTGLWINKETGETIADLPTWYAAQGGNAAGTYGWEGDSDDPPVIAEGLWGTCPWVITNTGELVISAGTGTDLYGAAGVPWNSYKEQITSVRCNGTIIAPPRVSYLLFECANLISADLSGFDTSNSIDIREMFDGCISLVSVDLSSFDTSNVTSMNEMFYNCTALTSIDLSNFDTFKVDSMGSMFYNCRSLTSLNLSNFDTSNLVIMHSMFGGCNTLTSIDLSSFNTSKVTNMVGTFSGCYLLASLDLSNFDTSNVTGMHQIFLDCRSLTSLDLSNFNTSKVTNMSNMFTNCISLSSLNISNFNTSKVRNMSYMFQYCTALTSLDLSSFDTSMVTHMSSMFYGCAALQALDLSNFNTTNAVALNSMFYGCMGLKSLDISSFDTTSAIPAGMLIECRNLRRLVLGPLTTLTNTGLPDVPTVSPYDGTWTHLNTRTVVTENLAAWYDGSLPGVYKWTEATDLIEKYLDDLGVMAMHGIIKAKTDSLTKRLNAIESRIQ